jgi:hemoglobin
MTSTPESTVYDAIGGEAALTAVVDDFYERVTGDARLAPFFAGVNMNRLKGRQVEFFTAALGGPHVYDGPSMKEAHAGRGISRADFDTVAYHLTSALVAAGVPGDLVSQIIEAIAPLADDIVSAGLR